MIGGLDGMGLVECPIDFQSIHLEVGEIGPITVRYEVPVEPIENLEVVTSVRNFFLNVVSHVEQEVQRYYIRKAVDNARHKWCARTLSLKQGNKHFLEKLEQLGIGRRLFESIAKIPMLDDPHSRNEIEEVSEAIAYNLDILVHSSWSNTLSVIVESDSKVVMS
ncbi:hypothetical protein V6N13_049195 [Hibiscus sabdariffa]